MTMPCSRCGGPALAADEIVPVDGDAPQLDAAGRYCINGCHL